MSARIFNISRTVVLTAFIVALPLPSFALSLITERSALQENDRVDWANLFINPPFTVLPNTISATSKAGLGLDIKIPFVNQPGLTPPLVFQTLPSPGIPTNFASGDFILFTGLIPGIFPAPGNPGPLTIIFDQPVKAAGAQIAVDDTPQFTAFISAYDEANNLLGTFNALGTSSLALDNSALFLGVRSDTANISRLIFSSSEPERAFGINALSLINPAVPEPSSIVALSIVGLTILSLRQSRSTKL